MEFLSMLTLHQEYKIRVPLYHQTSSTSCLATCMLMIGNFFIPERFPLTTEKEYEIHKRIKFWEGDEFGELGNIAKLIRFARKSGFSIRYFLESPRGVPKDIEEHLWKRYFELFSKTLKTERKKVGVTVIEGCDPDEFLKEVAYGRPVICEVKLSGFLTHALVIRGVAGNIVYVVDPLKGYYRLIRQELREQINLGYMKNALSLDFQKHRK